MAFLGMMQDVNEHGGKVVFPFGGAVYEVHLPATDFDGEQGRYFVRKEAATVLQCLTSRVMLEQQRALAAAGLTGVPGIDLPPFLSELHGSFADLVQQLQECVHWRREEQLDGDAAAALLLAAASLGHLSAAQHLMLFDPRASYGKGSADGEPAHAAAAQPDGGPVLKLLLAAAPGLERSTTVHPDPYSHWTLMHSAARGGNVDAIRLLLQLAPQLASTASDFGHMPLLLLLAAAPETAAVADRRGMLPMHWAAADGKADIIGVLIDAGAPGLEIASEDGELPLHLAANEKHEATVHVLLAAHPAAALVRDSDGRLPLQLALRRLGAQPPGQIDAARALLPASGLSATQLLDVLAAVPARTQPLVQPLYASLAVHSALTTEQWQRVPAPCRNLGAALPAVLVRSEAEAALLVAHLPPADAEGLRIAAVSLHRVQRSLQLEVPAPLVGRMLALALTDQ